MGTKPPSGPQPTSTTRAGAAGSQARTNGQFAASQRSSEVTPIDPTPHARAAAAQHKPRSRRHVTMRTNPVVARPTRGPYRRFRAADGRICCGIRVAAVTGLCFLACLLPGRGCTGLAARGYGTGVEGAAAGAPAAGVHGFPAVLTSFVGRGGAVREVGGLLR